MGEASASTAVSDELADLQNRFHLLEGDRKAFYEQSQLTLKHNKEVCDTLRRENKDLRAALSSMHKERGGGAGSDAALLNDAEVAKIETQLTLLRQKQNQLVHGNKAKEKQLTQFEDELRDLGKNGARPAHEANPLMRQIRTLENRLDKAMIKYNEAQSIRKTYDQIVKRLKEERVNFDNQLGAIEATLKAKEHDYEELLLMSHDASHAKDVAKGELGRLQGLVGEERKARDKELGERRSAVHAREEMNTRMEEREKARRDIVLEAQGDLGEKAEQALKQNVVTNALHHTLNVNVVEGEQQVMSAYEAAFRKIKESTGVSDVNEVIQKFLHSHRAIIPFTPRNSPPFTGDPEVPHAGGDPREPRQDDLRRDVPDRESGGGAPEGEDGGRRDALLRRLDGGVAEGGGRVGAEARRQGHRPRADEDAPRTRPEVLRRHARRHRAPHRQARGGERLHPPATLPRRISLFSHPASPPPLPGEARRPRRPRDRRHHRRRDGAVRVEADQNV